MGASGTEHPVVERWRSMARLGRSGRVHLIVGIQRPDAAVFGGEARDNFGMRVALGSLSQEGARMVFGRSDVARDVPASAKGRATVMSGDGEPLEVQTHHTPNPRNPEDAEQVAHLAALRQAAEDAAATGVEHITAETIEEFAERLAEDPTIRWWEAVRTPAKPDPAPVAPEWRPVDPAGLADGDTIRVDVDGALVVGKFELIEVEPETGETVLYYRHEDGAPDSAYLDPDDEVERLTKAARV
jgi:hypothetical protein